MTFLFAKPKIFAGIGETSSPIALVENYIFAPIVYITPL
jgi:hypothetical protein